MMTVSRSCRKLFAVVIARWTIATCRLPVVVSCAPVAEEPNAIKAYIQYKRDVDNILVTVNTVGLCVPTWCKDIGATPDGIVCAPGTIPHVLEVKCVFDGSVYPKTIVEIAKERGSKFYCRLNGDGELELRKNHAYYYQVLGEMATTGLLTADFVIYHPRTDELKVLRILFNEDDWKAVKGRLDYFNDTFMKT